MFLETDPVKISTKVYKNIDIKMLTEALLLMQKKRKTKTKQKKGKKERREGRREREERKNEPVHPSVEES